MHEQIGEKKFRVAGIAVVFCSKILLREHSQLKIAKDPRFHKAACRAPLIINTINFSNTIKALFRTLDSDIHAKQAKNNKHDSTKPKWQIISLAK